MKDKNIKKMVRDRYARTAKEERSCCPTKNSCCGNNNATAVSKSIGYSDVELGSVPAGSNLGLGCGNPTALASLKRGEVVLDLGSGAGFDCFLAANEVGSQGKVIGVDMTQEMIEKAKENARRGNYDNVEFRLGEIEQLPVADDSVDLIISNCVINLSPDKPQVFKESWRVLKSGGRLMVSDIVLLQELPDEIRKSVTAYVGCIAGAELKENYLQMLKDAGFSKVEVLEETAYDVASVLNDSETGIAIVKAGTADEEMKRAEKAVVSIKVKAVKG